MDPTVASADTASALQSALDAAYRERDALSQRLDEVDQLIADLGQASESSSDAAARPQRTRKQTGRKGTTKKAAKKSAKKGTKSAAKKSTKKAQRKSTGKRTGKRTRKRAAGGEGMGRTDRVVKIIADTDRPLTTGEVRAELSQHEPGVTSKLVSASLSYAQRKGHIQKDTEGRWRSAEASTAASGTSSSST